MTGYDKKVIGFIRELKDMSFDQQRHALTFPARSNQNIISKIEAENIQVENAGTDLLEIDIVDLPWCVFYDEDDFIKRANRHCWTKPILIVKENVFYDCTNDCTYINYIESDTYFLVHNNYYSYQFLDFLRTQDHQDSSAFYFVDYFNWDTRHVVLTSLKKDGKIEFNLPNEGITVKEDVRLKQAVLDFKSAFNDQNKHFPKFLKIELIGTLTKIEKSRRLEELIRKLSEIVYVATQNFEIYLHDLSLENLKKDFIEHKNKYFIQLREVLSKLTNQIIGLPLAVAASVFSTYKVNDSIPTLLIILTVFLLYITYSVYLLKIQKEDITDMRTNFEMDFKKLSESQFFKKFEEELAIFKKVRLKLIRRIESLVSAINLYFLFFSVSSVMFVIYLLLQMKVAMWGIVLAGFLLASGLLIIYILNQTLSKD